MKVLYIESRKKDKNTELDKETLKTLPKELFLAYSIQYKEIAERIKKQLEVNGFKLAGFSQVLGCTKINLEKAVLLIGSGRFHALNLAAQSNSPIYIYTNGTMSKIEESEIAALKKKKQGKISKFLLADKIGVIFSTKPGQYNSKEQILEKLKSKYSEKEFFSFISNNINTTEFENFKIDFWLNTACPGLANDNMKIENIDDVFSQLVL